MSRRKERRRTCLQLVTVWVLDVFEINKNNIIKVTED